MGMCVGVLTSWWGQVSMIQKNTGDPYEVVFMDVQVCNATLTHAHTYTHTHTHMETQTHTHT